MPQTSKTTRTRNKKKEYDRCKILKQSYYDRKLCTSCVLLNEEWPKVICKLCQRRRYLNLRIPAVKAFIEHYQRLLPELEAEQKQIIKTIKERRKSGL